MSKNIGGRSVVMAFDNLFQFHKLFESELEFFHGAIRLVVLDNELHKLVFGC